MWIPVLSLIQSPCINVTKLYLAGLVLLMGLPDLVAVLNSFLRLFCFLCLIARRRWQVRERARPVICHYSPRPHLYLLKSSSLSLKPLLSSMFMPWKASSASSRLSAWSPPCCCCCCCSSGPAIVLVRRVPASAEMKGGAHAFCNVLYHPGRLHTARAARLDSARPRLLHPPRRSDGISLAEREPCPHHPLQVHHDQGMELSDHHCDHSANSGRGTHAFPAVVLWRCRQTDKQTDASSPCGPQCGTHPPHPAVRGDAARGLKGKLAYWTNSAWLWCKHSHLEWALVRLVLKYFITEKCTDLHTLVMNRTRCYSNNTDTVHRS